MTTAPARLIVTTDPELDDLNSMLRLLLYSNEIDIAALVYSASRFHHRGDLARAVAANRWPSAGDRMHIDQAVDAYEAAYDNLVRHDPRYPRPADLRAIIAEGNIDDAGDTRNPTAGSDLVKAVLLSKAPGRVFAQAWGGTNTIARALMSIEQEFRDTDRWEEIYGLVVGRTVITSFAEQDDTFADYIRPTWPELEFRDVATAAWGYFAWDVVPDDAKHYLTAEWTRDNVSTVGPLGRAYRVWGDGKQMAAGFDPEDYFGVPGATPESLVAQGYALWAPLRPDGAWISEGDSSNFAMHIDNGLRNAEHPTFGGWGGRLERDENDPHRWNSVGQVPWSPGAAVVDAGEVAQWFGAYQRDFAARLRWSVTPEFADANHAPRILATQTDISVSPGQRVVLPFAVEDPDGDDVSVTAWQELDYACEVEVSPHELIVTIPVDAPEANIHIIVQATDSGTPALTGYARFVLSVHKDAL
ncbi:nucleoside hydrolase-like domain-containing protein [Microbacterium sp.]|uniref:nucleoside hydrolase-like domain-containing protein n=1 Tax=Microbacterium sp. TaxID=51671 RepID=UPI003A958E35